jgi:RNA polymerase sigma factor (sigma-70 family)
MVPSQLPKAAGIFLGRSVDRDLQAQPAGSFPPDVTAARAESRDRLRRAVLALPEDLRFAVTAHYWNEVPVAEIARIEGLTPPGVRKRLARAFEAIQAALEGK